MFVALPVQAAGDGRFVEGDDVVVHHCGALADRAADVAGAVADDRVVVDGFRAAVESAALASGRGCPR